MKRLAFPEVGGVRYKEQKDALKDIVGMLSVENQFCSARALRMRRTLK